MSEHSDKHDVVALRMRTLEATLEATMNSFGRATAEILALAATENDFADVKRVAPNALVVSSKTLAERGDGTYVMFAVDAKAQAKRIAEIIRDSLARPASTAKTLHLILERGREDSEHIYSHEVLKKYRPYMESALALATMATRMNGVPAQSTSADAEAPAATPRRLRP